MEYGQFILVEKVRFLYIQCTLSQLVDVALVNNVSTIEMTYKIRIITCKVTDKNNNVYLISKTHLFNRLWCK